MSWFLQGRKEAPSPKLEGPLPTRMDQLIGGIKQSFASTDAWARAARYANDVENEVIDALGGWEAVFPTTGEDRQRFQRRDGRQEYLAERVADLRAFDPQTFGALPGSRAEFQAEINRRDIRDEQENSEMLARGDAPITQFLGQMTGAVADETSLPLFFLGGSPANLARFIATEIGLGAVGEVPAIIKQNARNDRLGRQPMTGEQAIGQVAIGAAGGGVFSTLIGGGVRALKYVSERRAGEAIAKPGSKSGLAHEQEINAAERDLRMGVEPKPEQAPFPPVSPDAPAGWAAIRGGIFAGESSGDYNALFGFSNRAGGPFEDVRLTDMTVDEAIAFSAPDGAYGQWVKGQIGRVATPMGGYQIVGTTLRAAKKGLGLRGDELMTPELQERLGQWVYRAQGTDAWEGYRGPNADYTPQDPGTYSGSWARPRSGRRPLSTEFDEVVTPAGTRVRVRYRIVDLDVLKPATGDLQPRDRSRAASDEQIAEISARLDPALLMPSPTSDRGAPIIGSDMMIESGNGRVAALGRASTENPTAYQAYVDMIRQEFDVPADVKRPVLVAERLTDLDGDGRRGFIRESNTSSIGRMGATEQAKVDADYLGQRVFDAYAPGRPLNAPENTEFVRRMLGMMPQAERAALLAPNGSLNIDGIRRVRQALFARAFGADDLLRMAAETESPSVENLLRMLEQLAPDWAAFRAMVEAGMVRPEFDITEPLMEAVRVIARSRADAREGQSVIAAIRDRLTQTDMFAERDPMTSALIDVFYKGDRARRADASGEILRRYANEAVLVGRADIDDLAGDAVSPIAALTRAIEGYDGRTAFELWTAPARAPEPPVEPLGDIAGIDPARMEDGARSPAVVRADDALADDLRTSDKPDTSAASGVPDAVAELRAQPDAKIRLSADPDAPEVTIREVLDDLEADQALLDRMSSCMLGGPRG